MMNNLMNDMVRIAIANLRLQEVEDQARHFTDGVDGYLVDVDVSTRVDLNPAKPFCTGHEHDAKGKRIAVGYSLGYGVSDSGTPGICVNATARGGVRLWRRLLRKGPPRLTVPAVAVAHLPLLISALAAAVEKEAKHLGRKIESIKNTSVMKSYTKAIKSSA